eukprot:3038240-Lingulodinium_polyedra.AAC.1
MRIAHLHISQSNSNKPKLNRKQSKIDVQMDLSAELANGCPFVIHHLRRVGMLENGPPFGC